jgi:hypothetical protein
MKTLLPGFILLGMGLALAEEPFPPVAYPAERYQSMKERSPFVLPTFATHVEVHTEWTTDYRIVSVLQLGEESIVLAKKVSTNERIPIRAKDNHLGIRLVSVQISPDPNNVSAVIEMGGQEGTIRYDESILSQTPRPASPINPAILSE